MSLHFSFSTDQLPAVLLDFAIKRLHDLNVGITPVQESASHERLHKPLPLLAEQLQLIAEVEARTAAMNLLEQILSFSA